MKYVGFLYAIGAAVTWGLVYAIDHKILKRTSPINLMFLDAMLTTVIIAPFVLFKWRDVIDSIHDRTNFIYIVVGLCLALTANFLIFCAIRSLGASTASIFEIAYPFFVVIFSYFLFGATINTSFVIGGLMMFFGALIIVKFS